MSRKQKPTAPIAFDASDLFTSEAAPLARRIFAYSPSGEVLEISHDGIPSDFAAWCYEGEPEWSTLDSARSAGIKIKQVVEKKKAKTKSRDHRAD